MKNSTLTSFAQSSNSENDIWQKLSAVADESQGDQQTGNEAVMDFIIASTLAWVMRVQTEDNNTNIEKEIRHRLSRLNEEYPFDVMVANNKVREYYTQHYNLMNGWGSYAETMKTISVLKALSVNDDNPSETKAVVDAWNNI